MHPLLKKILDPPLWGTLGRSGGVVGQVTRLGGVTRLSILCLILIDHVYMIGGVTRRGLPNLPGVPHL